MFTPSNSNSVAIRISHRKNINTITCMRQFVRTLEPKKKRQQNKKETKEFFFIIKENEASFSVFSLFGSGWRAVPGSCRFGAFVYVCCFGNFVIDRKCLPHTLM